MIFCPVIAYLHISHCFIYSWISADEWLAHSDSVPLARKREQVRFLYGPIFPVQLFWALMSSIQIRLDVQLIQVSLSTLLIIIIFTRFEYTQIILTFWETGMQSYSYAKKSNNALLFSKKIWAARENFVLILISGATGKTLETSIRLKIKLHHI